MADEQSPESTAANLMALVADADRRRRERERTPLFGGLSEDDYGQ
ncbi:hypothetical protein [Nocardiopsis lucentensis]|nr:hypothetical protein [Nocardiopsis lucentensis]